MTRLIDADALTDELIKGMEADTDKSIQATFAKSVCMILCKALEKQPTIDAVPVIRCKDCDHIQSALLGNSQAWLCMKLHRQVREHNYCCWAERKEE